MPETPLNTYHRALERLKEICSEWGSKSFGCVYLPEDYICGLKNEVSIKLNMVYATRHNASFEYDLHDM
jgi:hypothetical protein